MSDRLAQLAGPIGRNRDLVLVAALIGILVVILKPLPTVVMDVLLSINLTFSILILLTTVYVKQALDFAVFPSLLLLTTLYRLALNIASTRLILADARDEGTAAAGEVIQLFGDFVTRGNAVVGFIIFVVLVVIQFVVITKGSGRIAEVAARFTLDKMPGQQLSIDADLNAGLIDEQTAKERRDRINREADFYGAMDGASKFVRGDAIAGIIITLINIAGGLIIGTLMNGWSAGRSIETFTVLTIGDGLVSQLPALVISISAGLIVTRSSTPTDLGSDLVGQVFSNPRAILITAGFLIVLIPVGLPAWVLLLGATVLGAVAFFTREEQQRIAVEEEREAAQEAGEATEASPREVQLPVVDPLELEVGYGLVGLVDPGDGGGLLHRVSLIREQLASELGLVIPPVRIRDNMQLKPGDYRIKLRGEEVGDGSILLDHWLAMDSGLGLEPIDGVPTVEPAFGIEALWIREEHKGRAEALGYTVVDVVSVLATHLTESIREHAAELLTREEVNRLIERTQEESPAVVKEVIPDLLKVGQVQKVLQALLREKVSIRDLEAILESLADYAPRTQDPEVLTEYVRHGLARTICHQHAASDGRLHVVGLDPQLEEYVAGAVEHSDRGSFLRLSPEMAEPITRAVTQSLEGLVGSGYSPIILTSPQIRLQVRRLLENAVPGVVVLSYNEVARGVAVESVGVARVE
ncbi:MAG: flagellar biosynthesis protein FlhA [Planctomycetota bacterium]